MQNPGGRARNAQTITFFICLGCGNAGTTGDAGTVGDDASADSSRDRAMTDGPMADGQSAADTSIPTDTSLDVPRDQTVGPVCMPRGLGQSCVSNTDCDDCVDETPNECAELNGETFCTFVQCASGAAPCLEPRCQTDADCNDQNASTADRCVRNVEIAQIYCSHEPRDGLCRVASDCGQYGECTEVSCVDSVCRYSWPSGCGVTETPYPTCQVGIGGVCAGDDLAVSLPGLCQSSAGACPTFQQCRTSGQNSTYAPAGLVVPGCAPPAGCPGSPSSGLACDPNSGPQSCRYDGQTSQLGLAETGPLVFLQGGLTRSTELLPTCDCDPSTGTWRCRPSGCPIEHPSPGPIESPSWLPSDGPVRILNCAYPDEICVLARGNGLRWECHPNVACPLRPPQAESCLPNADATCRYDRTHVAQPVNTYTGACECLADGRWRCDPSQSENCPSAEPDNGATCSAPAESASSCVYFRQNGSARRCGCVDPGLGQPSRWQCS